MSDIYKPGWSSQDYHQLLPNERAEVLREVDKRFRQQTGVTRSLNPNSARDLELRRTWLRIRDAVMNEREEREFREEQEFRADQAQYDVLDVIPDEMLSMGWTQAAELLRTWFERPPAIAPNYSAPVTHVIKMDWVLQFARAKLVYEKMIRDRIWTNSKAKERIAEILKRKSRVGGKPFGDLSKPVTVVDEEWINVRPMADVLEYDALAGALGRFALHVAAAGKLLSIGGGEFRLSIEEIGIYVKDSFDFEGEQPLGIWGARGHTIHNSDFRRWRTENHHGGDFRVFSDVKRTKRFPPDLVQGRL